MIKSPTELELMRKASHISEDAMREALAVIGQGVSEQHVASVADSAIRAAGAEPSFVTEMGAGPTTAYGTFLHHLRVPGQKKPLCGNWGTLDKLNRVNLEHPPETLCTECWKHLTGVYARPGVGNE